MSSLGFHEGSINIPGGDMNVEYMAPIPVNVSSDVITLSLCCRQDGQPNQAIALPTPAPFALLKVSLFMYYHSE